MSELRNEQRLLEIISYSKRPYFLASGTYSSEPFDSIVVLEDGVEITALVDENSVDVFTSANLSGIYLPIGTVIVWQSPLTSITTSGLVQLNRSYSK